MKTVTWEKMKLWSEKTVAVVMFYIFCLYSFFPPTNHQFWILRSFRILLIIILFVKLAVEIIEEKKIETVFLPVIIYLLVLLISSGINNADFEYALWPQGIYILALIVLIKLGIEKDEALFLKVLYFYCVYIIIANAISLRIWEYPLSSGYVLRGGDGELIGKANHIFCYCIPALFVGEYLIETELFTGKTAKLIYAFVIIFSLFIELYTHCLTDLITLFLWTIILLLKKTRLIPKVLNPITAIVVPVVSGILLQLYNPETWTFLQPLFNLMGRTATLSGRADVWAEARHLIKDNLLIGIGDYYSYSNFLTSTQMDQSNNLFLNVLLKVGVIGFIPFILIILEMIRAIKNLDNKPLKVNACAFVFCVLFDVQFDTYFAYIYFGYMALIYFTSLSKMPADRARRHYLKFNSICSK